MTRMDYDLDAATGRYIRRNLPQPALAQDMVLEPGQLAEIADEGRLQGILTRARFLAAKTIGPEAENELVQSLWWLHEEDGVLLARWRTMAGFQRFAATVEAAWKAVGRSAFVHYFSTELEPLCWSDGVDPFEQRYVTASAGPHGPERLSGATS
jgi:hypothetical protein